MMNLGAESGGACAGINDASEHTLNSFGYTLFLIQFLQTRDPPILPCLQAETISCNGRCGLVQSRSL
jgi:hypothetical protein